MNRQQSQQMVVMNHGASNTFLPPDYLRESSISPDDFIKNFARFLPLYIRGNRPAQDTLANYESSIRLFLSWCMETMGMHPFAVHDMHMRLYVTYLKQNKGFMDTTVALKISAIRTFYKMAIKLGFISQNPCDDIETPVPRISDMDFKYYTVEQIQDICDIFRKESPLMCARNQLAVYLMGVEGLRSIEVIRLNDEDINYQDQAIYIRGKGHDGMIFPCAQTFETLTKYISLRGPVPKENNKFTPTIICLGNRAYGKRITRNGLRLVMNKALEQAGLKYPGHSCHTFRHSCATNLYHETRDIRVVQETLRHVNPNITARYTHVHDRKEKRYTSMVAPSQNAN